MVTPTSAPRPSFSWTDEEKALLQRTLKVEKLLDSELKVEAIEGGTPDGRAWLVATTLLTVVLVAWMVFTDTTVDVRGLKTPTTLVAMLPPLVWLWLVGGFASGPAGVSHPVSLFPATPWFIRHRDLQSRLECLSSSEREASQADRVLFATDIDCLLLRKRSGVHEAELMRARQLIVERCAVRSADNDTPPERVVALAGAESTHLPRPFYVLLMRYLEVQSASADTLILQFPASPDRLSRLLALGGLAVLLGLPLVLGAVWGWSEYVYLGTHSSAQTWRAGLIGGPVLLAFVQLAVSARMRQTRRRDTISLSKHQPHLLVKSWRGGERRIPIRECRLVIEPDSSASESDVGSIPKSVFIRHGKRTMARWPLTHPRPSDWA